MSLASHKFSQVKDVEEERLLSNGRSLVKTLLVITTEEFSWGIPKDNSRRCREDSVHRGNSSVR